MARIKTYPIDTTVTENDIVIGSDGDNNSATRNYRMKAIRDYVLAGTTVGAQLNSDWDSTTGVSEILNKPNIPTHVSDLVNDDGFISSETNPDWDATSGVAEILNKPTFKTINGTPIIGVGNIAITGGGGGATYVEQTKTEIDALITNNTLVAGTLYKITGVHPTLYDDGTTSGTTIYVQALTTNELTKDGHGEFYNPKYNQAVQGFGIWTEQATYAVDEKVIWGGYSWTNVNGNIGAETSVLTLSADWTKDVYDQTNYNKVIDVIRYDYAQDMIMRRCESQFLNDVDSGFSYQSVISPISVFMFGNGMTVMELGVYGNTVESFSYFECVNFRGGQIVFNTLTNGSHVMNNYFTGFSDFSFNTFDNGLFSLNLITNSSFFYNTVKEGSYIQTNLVSNGVFWFNELLDNTAISYNEFYGSNFASNRLHQSSVHQNIVQQYGDIRNNQLQASGIDFNNLNNESYIVGNKLRDGYILANTLDTSQINNCTMNRSNISTLTLTNRLMRFIEMDSATIDVDINGSTILFGNYSVTAYKRPDGTTKLRYYNDSDLLIIADITD